MVKFSKFQVSLVKLNGSSAVDVLVSEIVSYVKKSISNISPDRLDPSLLRFFCNVVENSYSKKDIIENKIDKKVVMDVYIILKPQCNNSEDRVVLDKLIEDIHSSGQVLKVSRLRYYYKLLKNQLFSKKESTV